ncbi:hypothetical protein KXS11_17375 [Plantibacter flavus]|uniref:hypothetical protein n=1 Tax=Plantibacter flavus TaxID=150123 RepID=UPI003F1356B6
MSAAPVRLAVPRWVVATLVLAGLVLIAWLVACVVPLAFADDGETPWIPQAWWYVAVPIGLLIVTLGLAWWGRHRRTAQAFAGVLGAVQLGAVLVSQRIEAKRPFDADWPHDLDVALWTGVAAIAVGQLFAFWAERHAQDVARRAARAGAR